MQNYCKLKGNKANYAKITGLRIKLILQDITYGQYEVFL